MSDLTDALVMPLRDTPWRRDDDDLISWRTCPVCGEPWRPWHGSRLPCHAKCLLTVEAEDALLNETRTTESRQAKRLGVTVSVIRAGIRNARRRRLRMARRSVW